MQQRIYDKSSLKHLLADLEIDRISVYARKGGGLWEMIDPENVPETKDVECVAMVRTMKRGSEMGPKKARIDIGV